MQKFSCEELTMLSNDRLNEHIIEVRGKINTSKRLNKDARDIEIYFCYLLREAQNRHRVQ